MILLLTQKERTNSFVQLTAVQQVGVRVKTLTKKSELKFQKSGRIDGG